MTSLVELCPAAGNVAFYLKLQLLWPRLQLRYMASEWFIAVVYLCCHVCDAAYEHASQQKHRCCIECLEKKRPSVKGCNTSPTSGLCTLLGHETYRFVLSYGYILEKKKFSTFVNFK